MTLEALFTVQQNNSDQALAARYTPVLRFDANEPFFPLAAGYTIFRADAASPSMNRQIQLQTDEHPDATLAIEYAIWWDWDIGHLYELEHVWVYVDAKGHAVACEASWHGRFHLMQESEGLTWDGDHPVIFSEPGKHAFAPNPDWYRPHHVPRRTPTNAMAGCQGLIDPDIFKDAFTRNALVDTLVRSHLVHYAFTPSWDFSHFFRFDSQQLVPWPSLESWIPKRVEAYIAELQRDIDPLRYKPVRIAHRGAPAGGLGNTRAGIERAQAAGVDMLGVNLHCTLDGQLIASPLPQLYDKHGKAYQITVTTLDDLRAIENDQPYDLLSFNEICAFCRKENLGIYAELHDARSLPAVIDELRSANLSRHAIVGSFRADWLAQLKTDAPEIRTAIQFEGFALDAVKLGQAINADYIAPCWELNDVAPEAQLDLEWVARAHAGGLGVIGWHSENPTIRSQQKQIGLDAICTRGHRTAAKAPTEHYLKAICFDCGDTIIDEGTEMKDWDRDQTLRAQLIPGADQLLHELARRGYRLALVADGPAGTFINALCQHRLYDYFDSFAISRHLGCSKPDARMFEHALGQLGIPRDEYQRTLMIGNFLERDIKGANELGMISVWLDWAPRRPKVPADASEQPRYSIKEPLDLLRIIDEIEASHSQ
jgi:HAD superfamily hydrolase (TIGR01549 family)